ncbi:putative TSD2 protein required for DNA replication [Testicularia cyperi]|uniref:Putative TSD2 protein required for DNA replication n=1 Tax=Testicularia cyperi TaxID=1882483 RepID=A0A317XUP0_9BASI|nr:putative TSD2 protein required for DNA replication [Testicularia cyperi]
MVIVSCPSSSLLDVHIDPDRRLNDVHASSKHNYASAYARVRASARSVANGVSSVLILSAPDVDSVCATKIFTTLLIQDDVPHRIVPIEGYRSLMSALRHVFPPSAQQPLDDQHLASSSTSSATMIGAVSDIRSVICINLGAVLSLSTMLEVPQGCLLHVIDSHRPWNLENLFATSEVNDRIWCWDDGQVLGTLCRPGGEREAFERLEFDVDDEDSDDDDITDEDDGDDGDNGDDGDDGDDNADENDHSVSSTTSDPRVGSSRKRRRRPSRTRLTNAERHRSRNLLTRYYNRGENFGMSASCMLYLLCESLGRSDREALWLAIVGLTSLYLSDSIDFDTYEMFSAAYASEAVAMEPKSNAAPAEAWSLDLFHSNSSSSSKDGSDESARRPAPAPMGITRAIVNNTKADDADDQSIRVVAAELRFTLYRHWSLETSMYHTAYVAAKLGVWRERGLSKLRGLMAKMGFSLTSVRQNYAHMPLDLRRSLVRKLEAIAPEYGLTELTYRGFERSFGFRTAPLGAGDVVEGLWALLVAAHGVKIEVETPGMVFATGSTHGGSGTPLSNSFAANSNPGAAGQGSELFATKRVWSLGGIAASSDGGASHGASKEADPFTGAAVVAEEIQQLEKGEREIWMNNFYEAYRCLDVARPSSIDLLRSSLLLSQSLHRKIVTRGISMITNQSIRTLKNFRLAVLKDGPDLELFCNIDVLSRLGVWLSTSLRDIILEQSASNPKKAASPLPFVLAALHQQKDSFLVVGQTASAVHGHVESNHFTTAFQNAARLSGARIRHDRFQTHAIDVRKADLGSFIEKVHLKVG